MYWCTCTGITIAYFNIFEGLKFKCNYYLLMIIFILNYVIICNTKKNIVRFLFILDSKYLKIFEVLYASNNIKF